MATFNDVITLVNTTFPDTGDVITPADVRLALSVIAAYKDGQDYLNVTATVAGASITNAALIGKTVSLVVINDTPKNTGFNQPTVAGVLTFTDGTLFAIGDIVTIFYT